MRKIILLFLMLGLTTVSFSEDNCKKLYPIKPMYKYKFGLFLIDRLGYTIEDKKNLMYEITSWYGGDYSRLWIEAEGNQDLGNNEGEIERFDIMLGRWIAPFWDGRVGLGYIGKYGNNNDFGRGSLVFSLKGLAPYMFETDFDIRILSTGEVLANLELEYSLLLTQRLIIQPKLSTMYSSKNIEKMAIGSGLNNINVSLRLLYEIRREFAPYVELSNSYYLGNTKDFIKNEIGKDKETNIYIGLRMWF